MATQKQIILIKTAVKKLNIDDDTYKSILFSNFGVNSSKELDNHQVNRLLKHFEKLGFENKASKPMPKERTEKNREDRATWKQISYVCYLWETSEKVRNRSEEALRNFAKILTGKDSLEFISGKEASLLIRRIKKL